MSIWETVNSWAKEASATMSSTIAKVPSFWDPSVFFFKLNDQIYETGMQLWNGQADTPPAAVVLQGGQKMLTGDSFNSTVNAGAQVTADAATTVYETVSDAAQNVGDFLGLTPGSVPLSIKLAVAASLVLGVYIMISGNRRYVQ